MICQYSQWSQKNQCDSSVYLDGHYYYFVFYFITSNFDLIVTVSVYVLNIFKNYKISGNH